MKFLYGLVLLMVVFVVACGCTGTPGSSSATTTGTMPGTPVTVAASDLAVLSDAEPNATLTLSPGIFILSYDIRESGSMIFAFNCGPEYGQGYDLRNSGAYAGSVILSVPSAGTCTLNGTGPGSWSARVNVPTTQAPLAVPVNLSGDGTVVPPAFTLEAGEYIFQRDETGMASPIYTILFANGSYVMNANNTNSLLGFGMNSPEPFRIITIPESGTYYLSVIAHEDPSAWNASILAVPQIPAMGPGPVIPERT